VDPDLFRQPGKTASHADDDSDDQEDEDEDESDAESDEEDSAAAAAGAAGGGRSGRASQARTTTTSIRTASVQAWADVALVELQCLQAAAQCAVTPLEASTLLRAWQSKTHPRLLGDAAWGIAARDATSGAACKAELPDENEDEVDSGDDYDTDDEDEDDEPQGGRGDDDGSGGSGSGRVAAESKQPRKRFVAHESARSRFAALSGSAVYSGRESQLAAIRAGRLTDAEKAAVAAEATKLATDQRLGTQAASNLQRAVLSEALRQKKKRFAAEQAQTAATSAAAEKAKASVSAASAASTKAQRRRRRLVGKDMLWAQVGLRSALRRLREAHAEAAHAHTEADTASWVRAEAVALAAVDVAALCCAASPPATVLAVEAEAVTIMASCSDATGGVALACLRLVLRCMHERRLAAEHLGTWLCAPWLRPAEAEAEAEAHPTVTSSRSKSAMAMLPRVAFSLAQQGQWTGAQAVAMAVVEEWQGATETPALADACVQLTPLILLVRASAPGAELGAAGRWGALGRFDEDAQTRLLACVAAAAASQGGARLLERPALLRAISAVVAAPTVHQAAKSSCFTQLMLRLAAAPGDAAAACAGAAAVSACLGTPLQVQVQVQAPAEAAAAAPSASAVSGPTPAIQLAQPVRMVSDESSAEVWSWLGPAYRDAACASVCGALTAAPWSSQAAGQVGNAIASALATALTVSGPGVKRLWLAEHTARLLLVAAQVSSQAASPMSDDTPRGLRQIACRLAPQTLATLLGSAPDATAAPGTAAEEGGGAVSAAGGARVWGWQLQGLGLGAVLVRALGGADWLISLCRDVAAAAGCTDPAAAAGEDQAQSCELLLRGVARLIECPAHANGRLGEQLTESLRSATKVGNELIDAVETLLRIDSPPAVPEGVDWAGIVSAARRLQEACMAEACWKGSR
jgi:hypothetical protein